MNSLTQHQQKWFRRVSFIFFASGAVLIGIGIYAVLKNGYNGYDVNQQSPVYLITLGTSLIIFRIWNIIIIKRHRKKQVYLKNMLQQNAGTIKPRL